MREGDCAVAITNYLGSFPPCVFATTVSSPSLPVPASWSPPPRPAPTVACADDDTESQKYTAIAGGVEAGHAQAGFDVPPNEFTVTASFPGRMNWETGEPKPGRLDGWIILGNGKHTDNLRVWALCVPNNAIEVQADELIN